jgi:hypothetical protein
VCRPARPVCSDLHPGAQTVLPVAGAHTPDSSDIGVADSGLQADSGLAKAVRLHGYLAREGCSLLPCLQLTASCRAAAAVQLQEVPVLVAQAAQQLQQALDPKDTCGVFGVCPGSAAQLLGLTAEQVCLLPDAA